MLEILEHLVICRLQYIIRNSDCKPEPSGAVSFPLMLWVDHVGKKFVRILMKLVNLYPP